MGQTGVEQTAEGIAASVRNDNKVEIVILLQGGKFLVAVRPGYRHSHKTILRKIFAAILSKTLQSLPCGTVAESRTLRRVDYGDFRLAVTEKPVQALQSPKSLYRASIANISSWSRLLKNSILAGFSDCSTPRGSGTVRTI